MLTAEQFVDLNAHDQYEYYRIAWKLWKRAEQDDLNAAERVNSLLQFVTILCREADGGC